MARIIENPKKLILSKSKEILYQEGYNKFNMRNVARECRIALGTIYNYYPTKKELLIDMMAEYWQDFLFNTRDAINSDSCFYEKIRTIFEDLDSFLRTFKDVWLKPELYGNPDLIEYGAKKEDIYLNRFILLIEEAVKKENISKTNLSPHDIAKFIAVNMITVVQMPAYKYSDFENILREILG